MIFDKNLSIEYAQIGANVCRYKFSRSKCFDNDSTDRKIDLLVENCVKSIYNLQVFIIVTLSRENFRLNACICL